MANTTRFVEIETHVHSLGAPFGFRLNSGDQGPNDLRETAATLADYASTVLYLAATRGDDEADPADTYANAVQAANWLSQMVRTLYRSANEMEAKEGSGHG